MKRTFISILALIGLFLLAANFLLAGAAPAGERERGPLNWPTPIPPAQAEALVRENAEGVVKCLKEKDFETLSLYIHPQHSVYFAPSFNFITTFQFHAEEMKSAYSDPREIEVFNASDPDHPFRGTFAGYFGKFVYDHDYASAPVVTFNRLMPGGIFDHPMNNGFYRGSIFVNYYCPDKGRTWDVLTLYFYPDQDSNWRLVGVFHNQILKIMPPDEAQALLEKRSRQALTALQNRDFKTFSGFVHPAKGVNIEMPEVARTKNYTAREINEAFEDPAMIEWGYDDPGKLNRKSFRDFFNKQFLNVDFGKAPNVTYNDYVLMSAVEMTIYKEYPDSVVVQYYYPPMDHWEKGTPERQSLALVFEKAGDGEWYVTSLYRDFFTP